MTLLEALHIPTIDKQRVPVKTLVEQLQPTPDNKRLIESHVSSIYLVSILNEQSIHFRAYKDDDYSYQAIYVLEVALKKYDRLTDLSTQLHQAFQESVILLLKYGEKEWISVAPKHINKLDSTKSVIDDIAVESVDKSKDYLDISDISASNLKAYYVEIVDRVYKLAVFNRCGIYPSATFDYKPIIKEYEIILANINKLKDDYKNASMKAEKMNIDNKLYDEEKDLNEIRNKLRGYKE